MRERLLKITEKMHSHNLINKCSRGQKQLRVSEAIKKLMIICVIYKCGIRRLSIKKYFSLNKQLSTWPNIKTWYFRFLSCHSTSGLFTSTFKEIFRLSEPRKTMKDTHINNVGRKVAGERARTVLNVESSSILQIAWTFFCVVFIVKQTCYVGKWTLLWRNPQVWASSIKNNLEWLRRSTDRYGTKIFYKTMLEWTPFS